MTRELTEITVIGGDRTGLIANVTTLLFERGTDIEDLDQAAREGIFRMTFHADTAEMTRSRGELRVALSDLSDDLGVDMQARLPSDRGTREIAVLVAKESHCLEAPFKAWANDDLGAEISIVIDNHDTLKPLASHYDVPSHDIGDEKGTANEERLFDLLEWYDVDLVILARYVRILDPNVVFRYEDCVVNIHPSLLPAFSGAATYRQTKEEGIRIAGVTAHYVTTDLDQGPIIAQHAFGVSDDVSIDEIKERGQLLEADALLEAAKLHLNNDVSVHRGRISLRESVDLERYQLGLTHEAQASNPDCPVDGVIDAPGECEALAPEPSEN